MQSKSIVVAITLEGRLPSAAPLSPRAIAEVMIA
jgi:hypothetical protein